MEEKILLCNVLKLINCEFSFTILELSSKCLLEIHLWCKVHLMCALFVSLTEALHQVRYHHGPDKLTEKMLLHRLICSFQVFHWGHNCKWLGFYARWSVCHVDHCREVFKVVATSPYM